MRCISVYTKDYAVFSDLFDDIMKTPLGDNEERTLDGVVISDSGEIQDHYMLRLKEKPDVAVLKVKDSDITILQHGEVFEIFIPEPQNVIH